MTYEHINYAIENRVATITLNRPDQLNAFTTIMMNELVDAFDRTDRDDEVSVVIVTGAGRGFCAGADMSLGERTFGRGNAEEPAGLARDRGGVVSLRIFRSLKPVIAAINGPAVGAGITMTLPMDIRMICTDAKVGFVFNRRGLNPEAASSWFLPRLVGMQTAAEWVFTGRLLTAADVLKGGLVRSLHDPDDLLPAARVLALEIAENTAPVSAAIARQLMWRMLTSAHPMDAHRAESRAVRVRGASADAAEGVESFLGKRSPVFPMRVSTDLPQVFDDWIEPEFH
jgi:enoyl-CoA hydratase/carnithine racemase